MVIGDLQKDGPLPQVREAAIKLWADDPKLTKPEKPMPMSIIGNCWRRRSIGVRLG